MQLVGIDMQRISLGALIIALALLVDDAMTTTDATIKRLAQGDDKVGPRHIAFSTYAFAMLAGTLVTIAGFVPDRLCGKLGGRIHLLALCGRHHCADCILVRGGRLRAAALRLPARATKARAQTAEPGRVMRALSAFPDRRPCGRNGSRSR